jgi:hypothetical protein
VRPLTPKLGGGAKLGAVMLRHPRILVLRVKSDNLHGLFNQVVSPGALTALRDRLLSEGAVLRTMPQRATPHAGRAHPPTWPRTDAVASTMVQNRFALRAHEPVRSGRLQTGREGDEVEV